MSPSRPVTKMFHFLNKVHTRKLAVTLYEKYALKSVGLTSIRCLAKVSVTIGNQYTSGQGYKEIIMQFTIREGLQNGAGLWSYNPPPRGGGVLPEKLDGGVRPAFQNPYPIYDQNLRYFLPYLWPEQKFETLFMTWQLHRNPVKIPWT